MELKRYDGAIEALKKSQDIKKDDDVEKQIHFCERKLKKIEIRENIENEKE